MARPLIQRGGKGDDGMDRGEARATVQEHRFDNWVMRRMAASDRDTQERRISAMTRFDKRGQRLRLQDAPLSPDRA